MIWIIFFVVLGGVIGVVFRYLINVGVMCLFGFGFFYGMLVVNIIGFVVMGVLVVVLVYKGGICFVLFLMIGVLGGFMMFLVFLLDVVIIY